MKVWIDWEEGQVFNHKQYQNWLRSNFDEEFEDIISEVYTAKELYDLLNSENQEWIRNKCWEYCEKNNERFELYELNDEE